MNTRFDAAPRALAHLLRAAVNEQHVRLRHLAGLDARDAPLQRLAQRARNRRPAVTPLILKRRYSFFSGPSGPNTTQEATVPSPAVWLMSKHSMRLGNSAQPQRIGAGSRHRLDTLGAARCRMRSALAALSESARPSAPQGRAAARDTSTLRPAALRQRFANGDSRSGRSVPTQHLGRCGLARVDTAARTTPAPRAASASARGKKAGGAETAAAAHQHHADCIVARITHQANTSTSRSSAGIYDLFGLHLLQRSELVAQLRGALEFQHLRRRCMRPARACGHFAVAPLQHGDHRAHRTSSRTAPDR